jgi:hypothetical protein
LRMRSGPAGTDLLMFMSECPNGRGSSLNSRSAETLIEFVSGVTGVPEGEES